MSLFSRVFRKSRPKPESFVVRWSRQRTTELEAQNESTPEVIFISFLNYLCTFATPSPDVEQNDQSDAHAVEVLAHYANDSALFELGCSVFIPIVYWLNAKHPDFAEPVAQCFSDEFVQVFKQALQIENVPELVEQRTSMYREFGRSGDAVGQVRHHLTQLLFRACDKRKPEPYDPARDAILLANESFDVTIRALAWIDGLLSMLDSFDRDLSFWDSLGRNVAEQRKRADAAFRQAIKLKPDDPDAWYALGWAYGKQGKRTEAHDALDHLRKLNPSLADKLADFLSSNLAPPTQSSRPIERWSEPIEDGRGKGQKILITDDDACVLEAIKFILKDCGYEVVILQSKIEALVRRREMYFALARHALVPKQSQRPRQDKEPAVAARNS
jgi:tetratricopeptide (TPR) repeat protein